MEGFGYKKGEDDVLMELQECTLLCTLQDLDELIEFIKKYKEDLENGIKSGLWQGEDEMITHSHFRISDSNSVDFILATKIKNDSKNG